MKTQQINILVLSNKERNRRFKDDVIRKRYEQADLVLNKDDHIESMVTVLKDKLGLLNG